MHTQTTGKPGSEGSQSNGKIAEIKHALMTGIPTHTSLFRDSLLYGVGRVRQENTRLQPLPKRIFQVAETAMLSCSAASVF
jgi:hypothetical protein